MTGCTAVDEPTPDPPLCCIDTREWKLAIPQGTDEDEPVEVSSADLTTYRSTYFRQSRARDSLVFSAPADGFVQKGSDYPRSELREMNPDGSKAAWSSSEGVHVLDVSEAVAQVPPGRPSIVTAQVHGTDAYVLLIRLDGNRLYVKTEGDEQGQTLDPDYHHGDRFTVRIQVEENRATVRYQGERGQVGTAEVEAECEECYFKVGAYLQTNTEHEPDATRVGSVNLFRAGVEHTDG